MAPACRIYVSISSPASSSCTDYDLCGNVQSMSYSHLHLSCDSERYNYIMIPWVPWYTPCDPHPVLRYHHLPDNSLSLMDSTDYSKTLNVSFPRLFCSKHLSPKPKRPFLPGSVGPSKSCIAAPRRLRRSRVYREAASTGAHARAPYRRICIWKATSRTHAED